MLGFFIGVFFFDTIGTNILNYYQLEDKFLSFKNYYKEFGIWIVAVGGFTPIPYKVITIFSGFIKMNFTEFIVASFISRAARYFLIATLLYFYGKKIEQFLIKKFGVLSFILFCILILAYFFFKKFY